MQLTEPITVSFPNKESDQLFELNPISLKKFRKSGLPIEWYVFFAIKMTYSHKNPSVVAEHFCDEWGIVEHELDAALAKLQKKGLVHRPTTTIQLELFTVGEEQP